VARNALSYGDTDSDNPLARAAAYAAPWTTDGADTSVGAPSIGAGVDAVGQWMAARLAKTQGSRPTAPIWNPDNPTGTETLQSMGMPQPTNYAGPAGQYVNPTTGQLTEQGQARMDNPLLGFDTGGVGAIKATMPKGAVFDWSPGGGSKVAQIGNTEITYGIDRTGDRGEVILVKTPSEYRGQGSARVAMQQLLDHADAQGTTMFLNADPMGKGVSKGGLDRFYRSLGFVKNMGKQKDFRSTAEYVRQPPEMGSDE
jgi:hypothetical protein